MPAKEWKEYCCVPNFVISAMRHYDCPQASLSKVALALDVAIPNGSRNPFRLRTVSDQEQTGITLDRATLNIPKLLKVSCSRLAFRHLGFNEIPYRMYKETLIDLIADGCFVGIGYNYSYLIAGGDINKIVRHVSIVNIDNETGRALLLDDTNGEINSDIIDWPVLERAVLSIHDGYWIIAPKSDLVRVDI